VHESGLPTLWFFAPFVVITLTRRDYAHYGLTLHGCGSLRFHVLVCLCIFAPYLIGHYLFGRVVLGREFHFTLAPDFGQRVLEQMLFIGLSEEFFFRVYAQTELNQDRFKDFPATSKLFLPGGAPLAKAIMLALNSVNRLASTVLLTGGITPVVASGLIGGISWTRWFVLMSVPYLALFAAGAAIIYLRHARGFGDALALAPPAERTPLTGVEIRTLVITLGASLLWLTDAWHHWHPAIPALLAWVALLAPGIGVLTWSEFERGLGWANLFVLAASLSLAQAMIRSGAGAWLAGLILSEAPALAAEPLLLVVTLLVSAAGMRMVIPNITGFLALTIPVAMALGQGAALNPTACGLLVMIAGDAVLYYPAQSASSLVVYERGHLTAPEIFSFGIWMTLIAFGVVLGVALPYWALVGEPLVVPR
jgi:di/tricarboxylate transporter